MRKGKMKMKKKTAAFITAAAVLMSGNAFAKTLNIDAGECQRAVVMCYDSADTLVYSALCKAENGSFNIDIPEQYSETKKKLYIADTREFIDVNSEALPTEEPSPTRAPESTEAPAATAKPTSAPDKSYPSIYEKAVDAIYAPGVVKEVESRVNDSGEELYAVTMLYHGKEVTIGIEPELRISGAPAAYDYLNGMDSSALEEGDVVCVTSNIAGDKIKGLDFVFRPAREDIVTSGADYGEDFEKLIGSRTAKTSGAWSVMRYGEKPSSDRYQYAFGVVGKKTESVLTLLNQSADTDKALEIDIRRDTIVYTCDVSNNNEVDTGSTAEITTAIPKSMFEDNRIVWEEGTGCNYALVRIVDGTAADIVLYNNYNE